MIPKIDWLTVLIFYPLIVIMLMILKPLANKKKNKDHEFPLDTSRIKLIKTSVKLILIWAVLFLPLLLTGILDHIYILLLLNFSISLIIVAVFEFYFIHRKN